jgi:hypothetical protein
VTETLYLRLRALHFYPDIRLHGSEGGEGENPFRPLSWFQTTGFQPFSLSVGGEVRRKLLNPPAFSWWSFSQQDVRE